MSAPFSSNRTENISYENGYDVSLPPVFPFWDSLFDLATISLIAAVLLLSSLSLSFILHLRFKTRTAPLFHHFNSLWNIRLLLVLFIIFWAFNELIRLPFFRRSNLITLNQKEKFCKVHVILSLGIFEPGFLIILLFLLRASIRKRNLHSNWSFTVFFAGACFPLVTLQVFVVFFWPAEKLHFPPVFRSSSINLKDGFGEEAIVCTYPLLSSIFLGAYVVLYLLGFIFSCWKVCLVVINKKLRIRIFCLASTILFCLPIQIVFLGFSAYWEREALRYDGANLAIFVAVFMCAVVGEAVLVIFPIWDTLSLSGYSCRLMSGDQSSQELT